MRSLRIPLLVAVLLLLPACRLLANQPPTATPPPSATPAPLSEVATLPSPTDTAVPPTAAPTDPAPPSPPAAPPTAGPPPTWPAQQPPRPPLAREAPTDAQRQSLAVLQNAVPPERDDVALAMAYRGLPARPATTGPAATPAQVGDRQTFQLLNIDDNTVASVELTLRGVSERAYFWFDDGPGTVDPTPDVLAAVGAAFDEIYAATVAIFGNEANPGADGDPRVHIVNASPVVLCAVTTTTLNNCGLLGYFSSADTLPRSVNPNSNEREMFVMNGRFFGGDVYLSVLGHEFRHMIEDNYDQGDADWEVEGSAVLATDLLGDPAGPRGRANVFLANPDIQLNNWSDGNTQPHYGQGYLLNRYIYDRLGPALYGDFARSPEPGFVALDAIAAANGLGFTAESLWLDWLAALALIDRGDAPPPYQLVDGLSPVTTIPVVNVPDQFTTDVHQFAADYFEVHGSGSVQVTFTGSTLVPLLDTTPASGDWFWYAERANYSQMRLLRAFDLTAVAAATLQYAVYQDIEYGYDFAYVSVSTDGGMTWQGLVADHMQGLEAADDPSESAWLPRFYTGRPHAWQQASIDLSPYAGQVIQVRWEYVTDPILTFGGLAVDNIAVPEIGFYDDVEAAVDGWVAEGFSRVTGYIPQLWHLQLITFPGGRPTVTAVPLAADNTATLTLNLDASTRPPILIVAAAAPLTLEKAHYQLDFTR